MTQPGETDGYSAADHVRAIDAHAGGPLFSYVIVNSQPPTNRALLDRYAAQGSAPVEPSLAELEALGLSPVDVPLMSEQELLRHDPVRLARAVLQVISAATGRPVKARHPALTP
jgi:2-phospho-L-lactate transferase/gluconeogenesis factor (CofD/UPF0052 family)